MMDTKQPEALRLADMIESLPPTGLGGDGIHLDIHFVEPTDLAAAELRRLHEVNAELLEALGELSEFCKELGFSWSCLAQAQAAIAKATGEQA